MPLSNSRWRVIVASFLTHLLVTLTCVPFTSFARPSFSRTPSPQPQSAPQHRDGELLVRFRADVSRHDQDAIIARHGVQKNKDLRGESGIGKLKVLTGRDVWTVAMEMLVNPQVEFAEPNFLIAKDDVIPNDARFDEQWTLRNTGQNSGQTGSDINAIGAWNTTTGSRSTVIAVIDSGVDFSHPDLVNNQWLNPTPGEDGDLHGWDYIANSPTIQDEQGHGTAVAGIIAAEGNNSIGTTGVMWRASLMSLRVLDNTGNGDVADAVEAIDYAVAHGAQVINLSWGTIGQSLALKQAIERALRRGVAVVCSAGNSGQDLDTSPYYPASFGLKDLITVAATDNVDQPTTWSNWGARKVTVAAPGTDILTTQRGGGYWTVTGTSAAAPLVAGIAGLLKTSRPMVNAHLIAKAIADGARKVASLSGKVTSGGVASASEALAKLPGPTNFVPPSFGSGGTGPGGSFSTTPPPTITGAPRASLPNLDQIRTAPPQQPQATAPIQANLPCADCDPQGGGGAGIYPAGDPNFSTARGLPVNETGQQGVDLGSRNFNWSLPLVSLAGRAGLDVNLSLSYNSLVWTKDGSFMKFNADLGTPAPGFRLGLPTLQQRFLNSQTGIYAYMMITPSGGRVELRQVGTSNIYESQDSSYTQLDVTNPNALLLRTTHGARFTFVPVTINSEYRCTQIKDRNGNYISATYNITNGHLLTITDTLGRILTFVYGSDNNLQAIRQNWNGTNRDWATFNYGQVYVAPAFGGGLQVNGPTNNYTTVLTQVTLLDGSYFVFDYNAAFAQVTQIKHYGPDGWILNYLYYNLNTAAGQTECPRVTARREWARNWNGDTDETPAISEEATTNYSVATDGSWSLQTTPDGTTYREFYATSGWQTGLTTLTEIWVGAVRKKWTTIFWTQDDINLSYQKNPRVTDTYVHDVENNRRRVSTTYTAFTLPSGALCTLPSDVYEYAADAETVLRRTHTDYRYDAAYIDRRIIGLPSLQTVYDGSGTLAGKIWFDYDWPASSSHLVATPQNAVQHDSSYDIDFYAGRGNLMRVVRFDLTDPNNAAGKATEYKYGYDTNGSLVLTRDHLWHSTLFSYQDSFSDSTNRNTFAYPTTVTDSDGFSSTMQYNFDFGAVTRTQDPPPAGQSQGLIQTFTYDAVARLERVTTPYNNAYTRYVYGPTYVQSFSTVNNVADEAYSCQIFDGAGRIRAQSTNHPGSTGGYIGQVTTYDVMGRAVQQTKPTEITGTWVPVGDDSAWVYTAQAYDWKGRPTQTTLPDGATREKTYGGCGCAGGEVTTVRDENGRRRKFTMDVVGRLKQVDELNWNQTVYSTTTYSYNVRDQLTQINQAGQTRSFAYDGHGRLQTRTTPEQGATSYNYFADDTVQTITDPRGATMTFSYNQRHLVMGISFGVSGTVAATPNISFGYDAAGNRTSMSDGLGSKSYVYDQLSRMTSETRTFAGLPGSYTLSYAYNRANQLTSLTNQSGAQVGYNYDAIGRPASVSGSGYAGVSSYVSGLSYRAFGLKQVNYANNRTLSLQYDSRMRPTQWSIPGVLRMQYSYTWEQSGRLEFARNLDDETLDRYFAYDHVGRLILSRSGNEARLAIGEQVPLLYNGPYSHGYQYDQWGNMTYREGWGGPNPQWDPSYTNNKVDGWGYDQAGNQTNFGGGGLTFTYDATGQQVTTGNMVNVYDGDRLRGKRMEGQDTTYYLRSTVLGGQIVAELAQNGNWMRGYVYLGGELLAVQQDAGVNWVHQDPLVKSKRITNSTGTVVSAVELDPWGGETNHSGNQTQAFQPKKFTSYIRDAFGSDDAMHRRYNPGLNRFDQSDPYDGSYNLANPQSFNRYAYVNNDPVNLVDPLGLDPIDGALGGQSGGLINIGPGTSIVTVLIDSSSSGIIRGNGFFDGDAHLSLTSINFLGGSQNPTPQQPDPDEMIHCDPVVRKQINKMIMQNYSARSGGLNTDTGVEHGFIVYRDSSGKIAVTNIAKGTHDNVNVPPPPAGSTWIAFIHTHPPSPSNATGFANATPSRFDRDASIKDKNITYTYTGPGNYNSTLFNGRNPTNPNGSPRIISPPKCPK